MPNKYCNLVSTNPISEEYTKINDGFATVEVDKNALDTKNTTQDNRMQLHVDGNAEQHGAQSVTYSGAFTSKTDVKAALDQAKAEIDTIVVNASIDPEVALARISSAKDKIFATLSARLEESETELQRLAGHIPYGLLKTTEGFAALPCNFWRSSDGKIYHDFDFAQYKNGTEIYISNTGNNDTGDGTEVAPYLDMYKALEVIAALPGTKYTIKSLSEHIIRGVRNRTIDGKTIAIVPANTANKLYISSHWVGLTWTLDGAGTWKTTRSSCYSVFDLRHKDYLGVPIPLTNKATLAECQAEAGTWYTDNVDVWVHTWDALAPDDTNYAVNVSATFFEPTLTNNATLYIEDAVLLHGKSTESMVVSSSVTGGVQGKFIANRCVFAGGDLRINRVNAVNAVSFVNIENTLLFNCMAAYGGEDGFNYHYSSVVSGERRACLALEYNCISYGHGKFSTTRTSNCSTAHEGVCVLRISGIYHESTGPVINDANGCLSIYYDCNARDSLASQQAQRSAFRADNDGATTPGELILVNCNGGGDDTYSCYTGDDMDITLQAFKGNYFPEGFVATIKN